MTAFASLGAGATLTGPEPHVKSDIISRCHQQSDGSVILENIQDVEPVLESIKRGESNPWLSKEREMKAIAEIPIVVLMEWAKQHGMNWKQMMEDDQKMRQFIDDPDNKGFRIPG